MWFVWNSRGFVFITEWMDFFSQNDEIELKKATSLLFLKIEEDMLLLFV